MYDLDDYITCKKEIIRSTHRNRYLWLLGQPNLQVLQLRDAGLEAEAEPVGVDDDVDKVRVVKGGGGAVEDVVAGAPAGRPLPPEQAAQVAAVVAEAVASALGLELSAVLVSREFKMMVLNTQSNERKGL